jgi:hypothetical protein
MDNETNEIHVKNSRLYQMGSQKEGGHLKLKIKAVINYIQNY